MVVHLLKKMSMHSAFDTSTEASEPHQALNDHKSLEKPSASVSIISRCIMPPITMDVIGKGQGASLNSHAPVKINLF